MEWKGGTSPGGDVPGTGGVDLVVQGLSSKDSTARDKTGGVWESYAGAYFRRYGVEPVRNASVNSQLALLVRKLGPKDAEGVAGFYVAHNDRFYVTKGHAVGPMVKDAESLRTQWARGRAVVSTEARQVDRAQATHNAFAPLIEEARAREGGGDVGSSGG